MAKFQTHEDITVEIANLLESAGESTLHTILTYLWQHKDYRHTQLTLSKVLGEMADAGKVSIRTLSPSGTHMWKLSTPEK